VPAYTWISLAFFFVAFAAGALWAGVNARRAWRRGKPALARMQASSTTLSARSTELEHRLAELEPKAADLQRDAERLARSVAFARLQWSVIRETKGVLAFASLFVPRR
jgi:hypothetical protein